MTRRARLIRYGAIAAAAAGLLAAGVVHFTGTKAGLPVAGQVIPAAQRPPGPGISGTTLTGQHLNIARWRGHTAVIKFWGSWCVPCRKEARSWPASPATRAPWGVHSAGIGIREDPAQRDWRSSAATRSSIRASATRATSSPPGSGPQRR